MIFGQDTAEIESNYAGQVKRDERRVKIKAGTKLFLSSGGVIQLIERGVGIQGQGEICLETDIHKKSRARTQFKVTPVLKVVK